MSIFKSDLALNIRVIDPSDSKAIIKIVRTYSKDSISDILGALKSGGAIYQVELIKAQFYSGWQVFYNLVKDLENSGVQFQIHVNDRIVNLGFVEDLKDKVEGIKREDIY